MPWRHNSLSAASKIRAFIAIHISAKPVFVDDGLRLSEARFFGFQSRDQR